MCVKMVIKVKSTMSTKPRAVFAKIFLDFVLETSIKQNI